MFSKIACIAVPTMAAALELKPPRGANRKKVCSFFQAKEDCQSADHCSWVDFPMDPVLEGLITQYGASWQTWERNWETIKLEIAEPQSSHCADAKMDLVSAAKNKFNCLQASESNTVNKCQTEDEEYSEAFEYFWERIPQTAHAGQDDYYKLLRDDHQSACKQFDVEESICRNWLWGARWNYIQHPSMRMDAIKASYYKLLTDFYATKGTNDKPTSLWNL